MISAIAAIGKNRELGLHNKLLWRIPDDTKYFRETTKGHPVIMGRLTWESMNGRPLPGRTNIVLSRDPEARYEGAIAVTTVEDAIAQAGQAPGSDEIFIIGGAQIYSLALPHTDRLYLTMVDQSYEADAFFPDYSSYTKVVREGPLQLSEGLKYRYIILEKPSDI